MVSDFQMTTWALNILISASLAVPGSNPGHSRTSSINRDQEPLSQGFRHFFCLTIRQGDTAKVRLRILSPRYPEHRSNNSQDL